VAVTETRTREDIEYDELVRQRVERGMELLRKQYGEEWVDHIDCKSLDLRDGAACVLGQLYGNYDHGVSELGITDDENYGFVASTDDDQDEENEWDALQRAWERAIC
jgi:hypothetical protein